MKIRWFKDLEEATVKIDAPVTLSEDFIDFLQEAWWKEKSDKEIRSTLEMMGIDSVDLDTLSIPLSKTSGSSFRARSPSVPVPLISGTLA